MRTSSENIIEVEGLSKRYRLGATVRHDSLREAIMASLGSFGARRRARGAGDGEFWALRDVSFAVGEGEVVGVIGRNGAGKSTLLKILSRITSPTTGVARLRGRVASLLEVGTGFHPELTGRENIFLNGAILGMKKAEITRNFDEIVGFAEIGKFLDTPVKRYSSGMYVRLAFAVAAHLEPEILVVDEVLAVGDASFQKKCLGKMDDVSRSGRTIMFVSHNMGAVHTLTSRCIYLENGGITFAGETDTAVKKYLSDSQDTRTDAAADLDRYRPDLYRAPDRDVVIKRLWVEGPDGSIPSIGMGDALRLNLLIESRGHVRGANVSFSIVNESGLTVAVLFSWDRGFYVEAGPGLHVVKATVEGLALPPGRYYISSGVNRSTETTAWDCIKDYPAFDVVNDAHVVHWLHRAWGAVHVDGVDWSIEDAPGQ